MKDIKPIIKKLKDYIEKTEYWKYEDGLVLGSDEAQTILSALEENFKSDMKKNYLKIGDKVKMKDGRILTVKSLEFREFVALEEIDYQKKNDIVKIL